MPYSPSGWHPSGPLGLTHPDPLRMALVARLHLIRWARDRGSWGGPPWGWAWLLRLVSVANFFGNCFLALRQCLIGRFIDLPLTLLS